MVIKPSSIPKLSFMTLAKGARQLVVHDALLGVKKNCHRSQEVKLKLVKCSLEELTIIVHASAWVC